MIILVSLEHVALECDTKEHAIQLYERLFECLLLKSFSLPQEFVEQVFFVKKTVEVYVYRSTSGIFEVFITGKRKQNRGCQHVCIGVKNMIDFTDRCEQIGLIPYTKTKGEKEYVFINDMIGNIFEIKPLS